MNIKCNRYVINTIDNRYANRNCQRQGQNGVMTVIIS